MQTLNKLTKFKFITLPIYTTIIEQSIFKPIIAIFDNSL